LKLGVSALGILGIILSINVFCDPYWLFRDESPYRSAQLALTNKHRFVKSLQLVLRQPKILMVGSSRVYKGFDGSIFIDEEDDKFYNLGVSSLTLTEARGFIKQAINFTCVKHIILGLDLWMLDRNKLFHEGFNTQLGETQELCNAFFIALFSLDTLRDSWREFKAEKSALGKWKKNGFYASPSLTKKEIDSFIESYEKNLQTMQIDLVQLSILEDIITLCKNKEVRLSLYMSPLHKKTYEVYQKLGLDHTLTLLVNRISSLAKSRNIAFHDFSESFLSTSSFLLNSSDKWIDYSHFSPVIGNFILQKILEDIPKGVK